MTGSALESSEASTDDLNRVRVSRIFVLYWHYVLDVRNGKANQRASRSQLGLVSNRLVPCIMVEVSRAC